jgi:hypothetical protein
LSQAAPFVAASGDPHLLFTLRFNEAKNLCHLRHFAEAAERLPEITELSIKQGAELDSLRVAWLTARVDAGQGREEEAIAKLEKVSQRFTDLKLPYEAALSSLDLAVIWLKAGRNAEVAQLAVGMKWIFDAKGIERESLAALRLFCEAARREAATVELARRVVKFLNRAQHDPELRFETEGA